MKKIARPIITLGLGVFLALFSAALTYFPQPSTAQNSFTSAAFFMQATPTPQQQDRSEIGSTDEIVILGFTISIIITLPILLKRKFWTQP